MKKMFASAIVLSLSVVSGATAEDAVVPPAPAATTADASVTEEDSVVRGQSGDVVRSQSRRGGFFARLMELERRKNAWLRRTFLDR